MRNLHTCLRVDVFAVFAGVELKQVTQQNHPIWHGKLKWPCLIYRVNKKTSSNEIESETASSTLSAELSRRKEKGENSMLPPKNFHGQRATISMKDLAQFDIVPLRFFDKATRREMLYVYPDTHHSCAGWLLYRAKHGGWVTLRKATDADIERMTEAVITAHHCS
jgi:hypothetical protein